MENKKKQESTIMNWLTNKEQMLCVVELYSSKYGFIKIPLTKGYDILYVCKRMNGERISLHEELEYQGFYEIETGLLYNVQYELRNFIREELYEERSSSNLKSIFESEVRELIETMVGKFEPTIKLDKSTKKIQDDYKNYAETQARKIYLTERDTNFAYQCDYDTERFDYDMIEYVRDRENFVRETAEKYCETKKDSIIKDIVLNLMTKEIVSSLEKGSDKHLATMREIIASIPQECKMVNVTTVKEGKEYTFKYEASSLRSDCGSDYYTWNIPAKERAEFENLYGRHAKFKPQDITKITYCRNTLYEKSSEVADNG